MSERFQYLVSKYLDGALNKEETAELAALTKNNEVLQYELADALIQASAVRSVLAEEKGVGDEVEDGAELKPFSASQKHNSRRFRPAQKKSLVPIFIIAALVFVALMIPALVFRKVYLEEKAKQQESVAKLDKKGVDVGIENYSALMTADIVGNAKIIRSTENLPISSSQKLVFGDRIQTAEGSFITLKTNLNSAIHLNQNTEILIQKSGVSVIKGDIYAEIAKNDAKELYAYNAANNDAISIVGTAFEWSYLDTDKISIIKVKEGLVKYQVGNASVEVPALKTIRSSTFANGLQDILASDIASWMNLKQYFKEGRFVYEDFFKGNKFETFWTLKANDEASRSSTPQTGLICAGKDKIVELISPNIPLGVHDREILLEFEASNITGQNSFEYGYEVRSNQKTIVRQGYEITQVDLKSFRIREIRNTGAPIDEGIVKSAGGEKLPKIHFKLKLYPSDAADREKIIYKNEDVLDSVDIVKSFEPENSSGYAFQIKFYVKTKSDTAKVLWQFKKFKIKTRDTK